MVALSVSRPKSIATVVVVLVDTAPALSTPTEYWVIGASVVSGVISLIESTKVVLPAANPPATTTLSGVIPAGAGADGLVDRRPSSAFAAAK